MGLTLTTPALRFYSQTIDGRPYVNCYPYAMCTLLRWAGYDVPANYGMTLRVASGVPIASHKGISRRKMTRALAREVPNAPVLFEALTEAELLDALPSVAGSGYVLSVACDMELLPTYLRQLVGLSYTGQHAIVLGAVKTIGSVDYVWWMDPMGRTSKGYTGGWVPWSDARRGMRKRLGKYGNNRAGWGTAT